MGTNTPLQWIEPRDARFDWLNVADWEPRQNGVQPVRVTKLWRDQSPESTRRAMSAASMAVRFRTNSKKLLLKVTFVDVPDSPPSKPGRRLETLTAQFFFALPRR